ncbi:MAG: ATP-dependent zinc metalloprotease FtsH [Clostridia bacterium]|nr:ATP-dependent zinc metalloprotease FtsH [Clostridia bacterium]
MIIAISYLSSSKTKSKDLKYYEIVQMFDDGKITAYDLNMSSGALKYKVDGEETVYKYSVPSVSIFIQDIHEDVVEHNRNNPDDPILYNYIAGSSYSMWSNILPMAVTTLLFGLLLFFLMRKTTQSAQNDLNQTMMFGKARVKMSKDQKKKTTFDQVAGADEEKEELSEIVEFLKNPAVFSELGARIPKGVLLVGPPGTGKTLLARAVAGEADVPFFSISGSDFVEMYVGVGASRVRDLFQQAKKNSPSIVFIDEIDAVGRHRGAGMGGGHDEREQTLNQLLVEMDGFGVNEGVIIIAATNRPDILDPALLRPGRFDRQITVNYPDMKGRREILDVHAKGKPFAPDVDLDVIAKSTAGFTGAELENLLNESALLAARRKKKAITMNEIEEATIKVVVGTEKRSHKISDKEKKLTAYHEAGHAIATYNLETQDAVHEISIIPRGMAGGYTMSIPTEDKSYKSRNEMLDDLVVLLGGRVAEALVLGDISTGASNDIERASDISRKMVTKYGMSDKLGPIAFGSQNDEVFLGRTYGSVRNYSEKIAADIDIEINDIIKNAYARCEDILNRNMDKLHLVAAYLIENEKASGEVFKALMEGEELPENNEAHVATEAKELPETEDNTADAPAESTEEKSED